MKKKIPIWAAVAVALLLCLVTAFTTYLLSSNRYEAIFRDYVAMQIQPGTNSSQGLPGTVVQSRYSPFITQLADKLSEVDAIFRGNYIGELDDEALMDYTVAGYVAGTGDKFAAYYNADDFQDFLADYEGNFTGIGVNVIYNPDNKLLEVINVIKDSPAEAAGVLPGDLIYTVGEEREYVADLGYYPTIDKVRGEEGTYAVFTVLRGFDPAKEIEFKVVRAKITELTVMYHVYEPDPTVGVIKISNFDATTPPQFVEAVEALSAQGCKKLVIDLRYNPGGELTSIVTTLDYILPQGPIVHIMDADGNEVKRYTSEATELNMPMRVLVNGSTASAAELFTSAVRDYEKAIVVGTTTYGKGCMQTTAQLSDESAITVTYRMYNPPFSENYHGIGIIPDIEVELDEALAEKNIYKITDAEDNQLAAAVESFNP